METTQKARLPIEQRREIERILGLSEWAQREALVVLYDDINKYGRLVADQGGTIGRLLATLREIRDICWGPAANLAEFTHAVEESARAAIAAAEKGDA